MASSSLASSSSEHPKWTYKVFLSFRGETRKTFTSHLYERLDLMGIDTFQDDKRLEDGSSIPLELCQAIEKSQFAIVVFSKNYASSRWCLDELVKIMKCKDEYGQTVIPVFYDVDPSHIRHQRETFAEAFAKHELKYQNDIEGMQKVQGWRIALTDAANLTGHDIRNRNEAECIKEIVNRISSKLCKTSHLSSLQDVVGRNTHLEKVKSLLELEINDVRIVGIWGMGGIGKTTIAKVIFYTLCDQFDTVCLLEDVKENEKRHQLYSLQNTLLSELLKNNDHYVNNKHDGKQMMSSRLRSKKVLIVLDDIDHEHHVDYLAGDLSWFGKGSRVIITTRNKHLIRNASGLYEVTTLPHHDAVRLFYQHAFKKEVPHERFEKLSLEVVNHAKGLPLALEVWGCSLHKRDIKEWERAIAQMKTSADLQIVEKLKVSYDGLDPIQQQMFLDIACVFRGQTIQFVQPILESCFGVNIGLSVLMEKSLVFMSRVDTIEMHDLIQDMGKYIVMNMQPNPGRRSRLWLVEDFEEVMINNMGTESVEAIWIYGLSNIQFSKKALKKMNMLRILGIQQSKGCTISCDEGFLKYLSSNLRCFVWHYYPWELLPANVELRRLIHLDLKWSSLLHLWTGTKNLNCLRKLDLRHSRRVIQTPDFMGMPNLEYLDMGGCSDLKEVHRSLGYCRKLIRLDLNYCRSLKSFPCVNVESLRYLGLVACSSLEKFPEILGSTNSKNLEIESGKMKLPSSVTEILGSTNSKNLEIESGKMKLPSSVIQYRITKPVRVYDKFRRLYDLK